MRCRPFTALALSLSLSLALPAQAAQAANPYVTSAMLAIAPLMPPPPNAGSPEDQADLQAVIVAQTQAPEARRAQALADSAESISDVLGEVMGPKFTTVPPKTAAMFARIGESEDHTLDAAKPVFNRQRPWIAHPDQVKAIARPSKSGSYPSGHTTRAALDAIVMSAMVPEKQREIWERARDYAHSRVIGGMHYPSDIEAGWRAGTAMAAVMFNLPEFQVDFAAAKAELRAQLDLPAQ